MMRTNSRVAAVGFEPSDPTVYHPRPIRKAACSDGRSSGLDTLTVALRRGVTAVVTAALLLSTVAPATVDRARADSEIVRVAKSSLYGGALGLLLGGAVALVKDKDRDDALRWGLVIGVFGGFAWGVYSVSSGRDDFFDQAGRTTFDPSPYLLGAVTADETAEDATTSFRRPSALRTTTGSRSEFTPHRAPSLPDGAASHAAHLAE